MSDIDQVKESIRRIGVDLLRLAAAVRRMNRYAQRIAEVEEACNAILAPDPALAKANESVAEVRAVAANIGQVTAVTADWDENWQFIVNIRATSGHCTGLDGFDLRPESHGRRMLEEVLRDVLKLPEPYALAPPETPKKGTIERRVIWPVAVEAKKP